MVKQGGVVLGSDIWAIVANNLTQLKAAMNRISDLSQVLRLQVNPGKTELFHWAAKPQSARVICNGHHLKARSPVFRSLGHMIAHPAHASLARSHIPVEVKNGLNRYKQLPLNAFERVQLVNSVLIPKWLYQAMFVPHDRMFHKIDQRVRDILTAAKGVEPKYNVSHVTAFHKYGGLRLHQIYWAYRARYITIMQCTLRDGDRPITKAASRLVHHTMAPLRDYVHMVEQMGGTVPIQLDDRQRPQGGPELFDEEDSEDGDMLRAQERVVGPMEYRAHYHGSVHPPDVDDTGTLPAGFSPIMVGGMVGYTNGKDKTDTTWYSDGSKQNNRAGVGIKCGQLEIIARVTVRKRHIGPNCQGQPL